MAIILNLETATKNCSVGIANDGKSIALIEEASDKYIHSEKLHQFIQDALAEADVQFADLDAIAVSNGPGSYTGLRIGVSAAKGLCYALDIPLIAHNTNDVLLQTIEAQDSDADYMTVIDARRNEVFARLYNAVKDPITPIEAVELAGGMYANSARLCVVGDAAQKTADLLEHDHVQVVQQYPSARQMVAISESSFRSGSFADLAYHEPYYLKDFVAGKPRKLL